LSWAAAAIGLAPLVGAFAAGLVLEDAHSAMFVQRGERPLGELLQPMTGFLVPVFFVIVGVRADVSALMQPAVLLAVLALGAAAVIGKLCCVAGVLDREVDRLTVATGMIPRGEVSLVFAALGSTLMIAGAPVLDSRGYATIVAVVVVTTLVTPTALKASVRRARRVRKATRPAA
jgi:Kef-type K+ transport system membrane component KefB